MRFRKSLLDERGWRCEKCGLAGRLEIHHRVPVSIDEAKRYEPANCVVLCVTCHVAAHRRPKSAEEQAWVAVLADLATG